MNTPCPKCGSTKIVGLMAAFWVPLENDSPVANWESSVASDTELKATRSCSDCSHEWEADA